MVLNSVKPNNYNINISPCKFRSFKVKVTKINFQIYNKFSILQYAIKDESEILLITSLYFSGIRSFVEIIMVGRTLSDII